MKKLILSSLIFMSMQAAIAQGNNYYRMGSSTTGTIMNGNGGTSFGNFYTSPSGPMGSTTTGTIMNSNGETSFGNFNTTSSPMGTTTTGTIMQQDGQVDFVNSHTNRW